MAIIRWNPYKELSDLQRTMNNVFGAWPGLMRRGESDEEGLMEGGWMPSVDIYEEKDKIMVTAELPGMKKEEIDVQIGDGRLTIKGERKMENEDKKDNYHRVERFYGTFTRSFTLPDTIDEENISANYKDGLLKLTLPKTEKAKPKKIDVAVS